MSIKLMEKLYRVATAAAFVWVLGIMSLQAAPLDLAKTPLFLGTAVQPNIFFGFDDSGSMQAAVIVNNGAVSDEGFASIPPDNRFASPLYYADSYPSNWDGTHNLIQLSDFNTPRRRRLTCAGYNTLAYNPEIDYTPWRGVDSANNAYADATLTAARINPYNPTPTMNISNFVYFTWTDADNDGQYDGPAATDPEAPAGAGDECGDVSSTANGTRASAIPNVGSESPSLPHHNKTNFANWFVYYRQREFTAKRAISELIFESNARMGLGVMNNNTANTESAVVDMKVATNKDALLRDLSRILGAGSTPTRSMYEDIGRYFDQSDNGGLSFSFSNNSPILPAVDGGACQQNFAIVVSDGFWRNETFSVGNEDRDGPTTSTWDGGSHADDHSDTLADVAMRYYETDLATTLGPEVNTIPGVDENPEQHLVSFMVAFGVDGDITANPPNRTDPFTWPDPHDAIDGHRVDDMRHAAWNSRGEFLNAKEPDVLIDELSSALDAISARAGSNTAVTFNSNQLDADSRVFLTEFNSERWSGNVFAFDIIDSGPNAGEIDPTPQWDAASELDAGGLNINNRAIYTFNGSVGRPFLWGNLTPAQQSDLRTNPDGTTSTVATGTARLNYIRGDRSNEGVGENFRIRDSRLGDIVHSGPAFVGQPASNYPDSDDFGVPGNRYSKYKSDEAQKSPLRKDMVYVGTNGGMLHGFDASDGSEVMAYIPASIFSTDIAKGLHYLTDPAYTHDYYVNLSPTIADVYINNDWATILVGGLRNGGRGIFALDITDPSNLDNNSDASADNTVLWEYDAINNSDPDLGFTFAQPKIVKLNNDKWGVIFGNGYNNTGSGDAVLYILFVEEGINGWASSDLVKISVEEPDLVTPNGLSEVAVIDLTGDSVADRVYAGDLKGNVWAFDISSTNESNWQVAHQSAGNPVPLFTTETAQPVTVKGAITRVTGTTPDNVPNALVIFGTGQYLANGDPLITDIQSMYGVWDTHTDGISSNSNYELTKANLVQQTLSELASGNRTVTDTDVNYQASPTKGTDKFGWFFELITGGVQGERVVVNPIIRNNLVFFVTLIPETAGCAGGGSGWIMAVDVKNGGLSDDGAFNIDGTIDPSVSGIQFTGGLPAGLAALGDTTKLYVTGTGDNNSISDSVGVTDIIELPTPPLGRFSWQEMVQ